MTQPNELVETIEKALTHYDSIMELKKTHPKVYAESDLVKMIGGVLDNHPTWLRALLDENKRLKEELSHVSTSLSLSRVDVKRLRDELEQVKAEREPLVTFARKVIQAAFDGGHYDGGEIQSLGVQLGLLAETTYDPAVHGESDADTGDQWIVFSPILSQYPPRREEDET